MYFFQAKQKRMANIIAFLESTGNKEYAYAAKKAKWIMNTLRVVKINNKSEVINKLDTLLTEAYKEAIDNKFNKNRLDQIVDLTDSINMMEAC